MKRLERDDHEVSNELLTPNGVSFLRVRSTISLKENGNFRFTLDCLS